MIPSSSPSRRNLLKFASSATLATFSARFTSRLASAADAGRADHAGEAPAGAAVAGGVLEFIRKCARDDGGYSPSPDPAYKGNSDTAASDLAAVTYAAVLAKTMGWELPDAKKSADFVRKHQKPDGRFVNQAGSMEPKDPLAVLYNTTQGVVALRALGAKCDIDPSPTMAPFFEGDAYKKLPWYATSFFPLFYAALGKPFPEAYAKALADHMTAHQADDGYVQDHVAATFHLAHFFRLIGKPVPRAKEMVRRTIRDQKADGGWNIKEPDWDVHACFDALFILRQLGQPGEDAEGAAGTAAAETEKSKTDDGARCREAIARGGRWALGCRNDDGGFGHFPGRHSDMDAVYFNFGSLLQSGLVTGMKDLPDAQTLSWGHAMRPGKVYELNPS